MKRIVAITVLIVATLVSAPAQAGNSSPENESPEQAIRQLESELWVAYSRGDKAALDRLLAADLTFTKEMAMSATKRRK